ncbi:MAG: hypothetical protein Q9160_007956 [Pyrenula sp. 1 TL-2023]
MADIYSKSYFTLSAATIAHPGVSLFQEISLPMRTRPHMVVEESTSQGQPKPFVLYAKRVDYFKVGSDVQKYPLMERGWVYQEYLLSARLIFFHESGLGWVCNSCALDESESQNFLDLADLKLRRAATMHHVLTKPTRESDEISSSTRGDDWNQSIAKEWRRNVSQYCSLKLTFETDRLPAIGGIAAQMALKRPGPYLCGLWRDSLLKDLTWYTWSTNKNLLTGLPCSSKHSAARPKPTWSWTSVVGEHAAFQCHPRGDRERFLMDVIDAHCEVKGSNPFGQVNHGFIKASGPLLRATPRFDLRPEEIRFSHGGGSEARLNFRLDYPLSELEAANMDIFCLPIISQSSRNSMEWGERDVSRTIFLMLVPHDGPSHDRAFERIGLAYVSKLVDNFDQEVKEQITIV